MSCVICGRGACCKSFHSLEEQSYFDKAEEAYGIYLEVVEQCRREYQEACAEEEEEEDRECPYCGEQRAFCERCR